MPSKSRTQQRLMGAAWAYRKGKIDDAPEESKKIANSNISDKSLHAFAATKHKGLPERIKEALMNESLNESYIPKYANRYVPKFTTELNKMSILIMPEYVKYAGEIIKIFESKGFTIQKMRTKMLLAKEATQILKDKKEQKWYKMAKDELSSAPSMCIRFEYDGFEQDDNILNLEKAYELVEKKIRRILELNNIHSCYLKDIPDWQFFGTI